MTAKTSTERSRDRRKRNAAAGLAEVRGIIAPLKVHERVRQMAMLHVLDIAMCKKS